MRDAQDLYFKLTVIAVFVVLFLLHLLGVKLKLPVDAGTVLFEDKPAISKVGSGDLFWPQKNPFLYKKLPITPVFTPSITPVVSVEATAGGAVTISPSVSVTPSVSVGVTPTLEVTSTPSLSPSSSLGVTTTPTITPTVSSAPTTTTPPAPTSTQ